MAGLVRVGGRVVTKPSETVSETDHVEATLAHPYVSRGGVKLAHALDVFGVDPAGQVALDIGASTGGFTQVLLERGAQRVYAVDVGRDQLHRSLRGDPRIVSLENQDARSLTADQIATKPTVLVCDASFISAAAILPAPLSLLAPLATVIVLVKPQFEVGRAHVGKRGIVKDEALQLQSVQSVSEFLATRGFEETHRTISPVAGGDGNREWLLAAKGRISPTITDKNGSLG